MFGMRRKPPAYLGAAEVAELELVGAGVHQQVLGLDVAVADAHGVDVPQSPAHLHRHCPSQAAQDRES